MPPSIIRDCPVTHEEASDSRYTIPCAMSSGSPYRFNGYSDISFCNCSSDIVPDLIRGVFTIPGFTLLTRIFLGASSIAQKRVIDCNAAFAAPYMEFPTEKRSVPPIEQTKTTEAEGLNFFFFTSNRNISTGAKKLILKISSNFSRVANCRKNETVNFIYAVYEAFNYRRLCQVSIKIFVSVTVQLG